MPSFGVPGLVSQVPDGSDRAGQVVFIGYPTTLEADALKLVAQKLQSSLAVEGELLEDGLAA